MDLNFIEAKGLSCSIFVVDVGALCMVPYPDIPDNIMQRLSKISDDIDRKCSKMLNENRLGDIISFRFTLNEYKYLKEVVKACLLETKQMRIKRKCFHFIDDLLASSFGPRIGESELKNLLMKLENLENI